MSEYQTEIVYACVSNYVEEWGYSPSLKEIGAQCYMAPSTALRYLDRLEVQGRIVRTPGQARSIRLVPKPESNSGQPEKRNKYSNGCSPQVRTSVLR